MDLLQVPPVPVFIGSTSDEENMKPCTDTLTAIGLPWGLHVASAHRNPEFIREFASFFSEDTPIIGGAGWSAALPGTIESWLQAFGKMGIVIGVPLPSREYPSGEDASISMIRMPPGIPVFVVGHPKNAAIAAAKIIALGNTDVRSSLTDYLTRESAAKPPQLGFRKNVGEEV